MRYDAVLSEAEAREVLDEVLAATTHDTVAGRGVFQQGSDHYQFAAELDVPGERWRMVTSKNRTFSFEDGVITWPVDPPTPAEFGRGMPLPLQLLHPVRLLLWGRGRESFRPMLVQRIGSFSTLITFEHRDDPAFRGTLVLDRQLGVIRKRSLLGDVIVYTDVVVDQPLTGLDDVTFVPITDWIPPRF